MEQIKGADRPRKFIPSLEGVRGYAFLVVFMAHCSDKGVGNVNRWWGYPIRLLHEIKWVSVPVFFVLSGFLICGILVDTREREGFFKIFYSRRILRVFPLYYLTLLAVALSCVLNGERLGFHFWSHFFYIQNLFPSYVSSPHWALRTQIGHLWSMAVEEQFYLLWPLVVWLCPNRRVLLKVTLALIACSFAIRFAAPWLSVPAEFLYYWTPTRVDAILMGAVLAVIRREPLYNRITPFAKYVALAGLAVMVLFGGGWSGDMPTTYRGEALLIPLWNLTAAAIVVAVMQEGSRLSRVCSGKTICWLGARSYALYLFHFVYLDWVLSSAGSLARFMPHFCANLAATLIAFGVTVALAALSYRLIETPAMNLKTRLKYGAIKKPHGALIEA